MWADAVVEVAVVVELGLEGEPIGNLLAVEPLVLGALDPALDDPVRLRRLDARADMRELRLGVDEALEAAGAEAGAVVGG